MNRSGFTLIEILVAIAIMTIIMGVVIFDHQKFSERMRINNLTYQIALSIRESQAYGINVRGLTDSTSQRFDIGYGISFDTKNPTSYSTFWFDNAGKETKISTYNLERGNKIKQVCKFESLSQDCNSGIVDIRFKRPYPDAFFAFNGGSLPNTQRVEVEIVSPSGICKVIEVNKAGQISTDDCSI